MEKYSIQKITVVESEACWMSNYFHENYRDA